jgi:curved DNA-binding protein CbpA
MSIDATGTLYETLGVDPTADAETIKKAYKRKAHKAHPDKGGTKEEFHAVQRAFSILSDEDKRKTYDETGNEQQQFTNEELAYQQLSELMLALIDNADTDSNSLVDMMKSVTLDVIAKKEAEIKLLRKKISWRNKTIKRLKRKDNGDNILARMLKNAKCEKQIKELEASKDIAQLMIKLVDGYIHEITASEPVPEW